MKISRVVTLLVSIGMMVSCNVTKNVPEGSYLLTKNKIKVVDKDRTAKTDLRKVDENASAFLKQQPNKRILGINFYLGVYNMAKPGDSSKFNKFLRRIGEEPTILDSSKVALTDKDLKLYYDANGFFNSKISDTILAKEKKAQVEYTVSPGEPYRISGIKYQIRDKFIAPIVMKDTAQSLIGAGQIFTRDALDSERARVTTMLRNRGFYGFNKSYISYYADSTLGNHTVSLTMTIRQRIADYTKEGLPIYENHPIYRIGQIYVQSDYDPAKDMIATRAADDMDTLEYHGISFIYKKRLPLRAEVLSEAISLSPNELYSDKFVNYTYENLNNLGFFRSSNIVFAEGAEAKKGDEIYVSYVDSDKDTVFYTRQKELVCTIQCSPSPKQGVKASFEATTTSNYYSMGLTLGYQNKNIFRGAELFSVGLRGAYEIVTNSKNSYELGGQTSLTFPKFIFPWLTHKFPSHLRPKTKIELSASTQKRPDYNRNLFNLTFGYTWSPTVNQSLTINPIALSLVQVPWVNEKFLNTIENPYLKNSYTNQLISALYVAYTYGASRTRRLNNWTLRANGEMSGNLMSLGAQLFSEPVSSSGERYYKAFGVRFAQYFRAEADLSHKIMVGKKSNIVWRLYAAGGKPYGNSNALPFERLFFAGGSNSMRGWQVRTLGPGSVLLDTVSSYPNQLGDFKLEANLEYRFPVIGPFEGALFFDLGNIWYVNKGEERPEARFKFNTFYKQLAFNTGLGARFDLSFLIFRVDWGVRLHNPNMPYGQRWVHNLMLKNTAFHFAIGYPF